MRRICCRVAAATAAAVTASATGIECTAGPPGLDARRAEDLSRHWVKQESQAGYIPPSAAWPPPKQQPSRSDIQALQRALARCGGVAAPACHELGFSLAVALLGGALTDHAREEDDLERSAEERMEGSAMMQELAERGSLEATCGWAYCLLAGEIAQQGVPTK